MWWPAPAKLRASFTDGQAMDATLVGEDADTDTAVLRLSGNGLPHAELGPVGDAAGRAAGGGDRQSARLPVHRHRRHRVRARAHAAHALGAHDRQRDPDRRAAEPGQFRRSAGERGRAGGRHQHRDDRAGAGHLLRDRHRYRGLGGDAADARRAGAAVAARAVGADGADRYAGAAVPSFAAGERRAGAGGGGRRSGGGAPACSAATWSWRSTANRSPVWTICIAR